MFGRRDGLHDLNGNSPGNCRPAFLVCSAPAPLRAPSRRPPRRLGRDWAPAPRTHARSSRPSPGEAPLSWRARPLVPQPDRTLIDAHTPTRKFRTDGTAHSLCKRCVAPVVAVRGTRHPAVRLHQPRSRVRRVASPLARACRACPCASSRACVPPSLPGTRVARHPQGWPGAIPAATTAQALWLKNPDTCRVTSPLKWVAVLLRCDGRAAMVLCSEL